jgi:D-glycero-D-manno-heptose 1,7-bisphosphate phosphatase
MYGILVFWYSGLAGLKTRFLSWEVAFSAEKSRIPFWAWLAFWYSGLVLAKTRSRAYEDPGLLAVCGNGMGHVCRLGRRLGGSMSQVVAGRPGVFLDRDGTLIEDRGHLAEVSQVVFYPETVGALRRLQERFLLFLVTNQSGVARGLIRREDVDRVNARVVSYLAEQGVTLAAVYVCPHQRADGCRCIKPNPHFLHRAATEHGVDLRRSFTVGDHPHDVELARPVGARGVYVRTGHGEKHVAELSPDEVIVAGIAEAADWILASMMDCG